MDYCYACKERITINNEIVQKLERALNKQSRFNPESIVYCPAQTIEGMHFRQSKKRRPRAWMSLYRMIVEDYENDRQERQYWLSGIALFNGIPTDKCLKIPRDRNKAIITGHWMIPKAGSFKSVYLPGHQKPTGSWQSKRYGYPVHARCWSLIERVIGPEAEKDLATFMETLRQRLMILILDRFVNQTNSEDPFRIPKVDNLLKSVVAKRQVITLSNAVEGEEIAVKPYNTRRLCRRLSKPGIGPFGAFKLPLDVQYPILDDLSPNDISALHSAFTGPFEWSVPDLYWFRRAPRALVFEIQDLRNTEINESTNKQVVKIDWEFSCLQADELVSNSDGLQNRRRIMGILEDTKSHFLQMMQGK